MKLLIDFLKVSVIKRTSELNSNKVASTIIAGLISNEAAHFDGHKRAARGSKQRGQDLHACASDPAASRRGKIGARLSPCPLSPRCQLTMASAERDDLFTLLKFALNLTAVHF